MQEQPPKAKQGSPIDKKVFKKRQQQNSYSYTQNAHQLSTHQYGKKLNQILYVKKQEFSGNQEPTETNKSFQADNKLKNYFPTKTSQPELADLAHRRNYSLETQFQPQKSNTQKKSVLITYTKRELLNNFSKSKLIDNNFLKLSKQNPECFTYKILYPHNIAIQFALNKDEWWYDAKQYQQQRYQKQNKLNQGTGYSNYNRYNNNNKSNKEYYEDEEEIPEWAEDTLDPMNTENFEFKTFEKTELVPAKQLIDSPGKSKQLKDGELNAINKQNDSQFNLNKFIQDELQIGSTTSIAFKLQNSDDYYSQIDLLMDQKIKNGLFEINEEEELVKKNLMQGKQEGNNNNSDEEEFSLDDNSDSDQDLNKSPYQNKDTSNIPEPKSSKPLKENDQKSVEKQLFKEFKLEDFLAQGTSLLEMELQKEKNEKLNFPTNDLFKNQPFFNFGDEEASSINKTQQKQQQQEQQQQQQQEIQEQQKEDDNNNSINNNTNTNSNLNLNSELYKLFYDEIKQNLFKIQQLSFHLYSLDKKFNEITLFIQFTECLTLSKKEEQTWYYIDPDSQKQGPFSSIDMDVWNMDKYFEEDLEISWRQSEQFVTIKEFKVQPAVMLLNYFEYLINQKKDINEFNFVKNIAEIEEFIKQINQKPIKEPISQSQQQQQQQQQLIFQQQQIANQQIQNYYKNIYLMQNQMPMMNFNQFCMNPLQMQQFQTMMSQFFPFQNPIKKQRNNNNNNSNRPHKMPAKIRKNQNKSEQQLIKDLKPQSEQSLPNEQQQYNDDKTPISVDLEINKEKIEQKEQEEENKSLTEEEKKDNCQENLPLPKSLEEQTNELKKLLGIMQFQGVVNKKAASKQ